MNPVDAKAWEVYDRQAELFLRTPELIADG
jgi:hypothetical protein